MPSEVSNWPFLSLYPRYPTKHDMMCINSVSRRPTLLPLTRDQSNLGCIGILFPHMSLTKSFTSKSLYSLKPESSELSAFRKGRMNSSPIWVTGKLPPLHTKLEAERMPSRYSRLSMTNSITATQIILIRPELLSAVVVHQPATRSNREW